MKKCEGITKGLGGGITLVGTQKRFLQRWWFKYAWKMERSDKAGTGQSDRILRIDNRSKD